MGDLDWRGRAACRSAEPVLREAAFGRADEQALFIGVFCRHCPVRRDCFEFAAGHDWEGVYGGTTARQRRAFKKKRLAA